MGRNDPSDIVSEEAPKWKKKFELTEKSTECSCDLDPVLLEYAKKLKETKFLRTPFLQNTSRWLLLYKDNFMSNQTINEIMFFNPVPENLKADSRLGWPNNF